MRTPIVLTLANGARCITTMEALEAAATTIHQKSVRERSASGQPSTPTKQIEGQISPINAKRNNPPKSEPFIPR